MPIYPYSTPSPPTAPHYLLQHRHTPRLPPLAKQQTDALPVVHPPNALRDRRADVDGDEFRAERLVLELRDGVGDLEVEELVSKGWRRGGRKGKGDG